MAVLSDREVYTGDLTQWDVRIKGCEETILTVEVDLIILYYSRLILRSLAVKTKIHFYFWSAITLLLVFCAYSNL